MVIDLTNLEDCLVCGAYEALVFGKPLLVSKTKVLMDYFGDAVVLTENTPEAICQGVLRTHAQSDDLVRNGKNWVNRNERYMNERITQLKATLSSLPY